MAGIYVTDGVHVSRRRVVALDESLEKKAGALRFLIFFLCLMGVREVGNEGININRKNYAISYGVQGT